MWIVNEDYIEEDVESSTDTDSFHKMQKPFHKSQAVSRKASKATVSLPFSDIWKL